MSDHPFYFKGLPYLYRADDGEEMTEHYPPGRAPDQIQKSGKSFKRVYTVPGLAFRGPGFYTTDSKGKK